MEKRRYGKSNIDLSVVGFGGIVVMNEAQEVANRMVAEAIERGINYFDVAPSYGNAEERLGPALKPYRNSVFLACKTAKRTKREAWEELHQSLKRLCTDYFDLYQLHAVTTIDEVNQIFSDGGAIEALIEAKEQGIVKYLGFSAHSEEVALALLDRFNFDSILFPINWVCWYQGNFGPKVVEKAREKGVAILALKTFAKRKLREDEKRKWPKCWYYPVENFEEALMAVRFTLSLPVTAAVSPSHAELLWWMCDAVEMFRPLSKEEEQELAERSKGLEPIFPIKH
ncbi:MAG: aldo/keto reductase [Candidatus Bathyarchaeia archaeon]|nr:aldo/keto reductase [Candidatus Bathyarchaeota archaeon]